MECVDGDKEAAVKKKVVYARKKPVKKPAADAAAEEEAAKAAAAAAEAEAAAAKLAEVILCSQLQTLGHSQGMHTQQSLTRPTVCLLDPAMQLFHQAIMHPSWTL